MEGSVEGSRPPVLQDEGKVGKDPNLAESRAQALLPISQEGRNPCLRTEDDLFTKNPIAGLLATVDPERLPSVNSGSFQDLVVFHRNRTSFGKGLS